MKTLKQFVFVAWAVLFVSILSISTSTAAAYIKYDGVTGEALDSSTDPAHGIDLGQPNPRLTMLLRSGNGGGTLQFSRQSDRASRLLATWGRERHRFGSLIIYATGPTGSGTVAYSFTECIISGYSISADDSLESEIVTLSFGSMELTTESTGPRRR